MIRTLLPLIAVLAVIGTGLAYLMLRVPVAAWPVVGALGGIVGLLVALDALDTYRRSNR